MRGSGVDQYGFYGLIDARTVVGQLIELPQLCALDGGARRAVSGS